MNVGTMTGKGSELVDRTQRRKVDRLCPGDQGKKGSMAISLGEWRQEHTGRLHLVSTVSFEGVVGASPRTEVDIGGFMPKKSKTDAAFALRMLIKKVREGQGELHCVLIDLEKA